MLPTRYCRKMVEIARKKVPGLTEVKGYPRYIISSASDLPFNNSTFDAVTISLALEILKTEKSS